MSKHHSHSNNPLVSVSTMPVASVTTAKLGSTGVSTTSSSSSSSSTTSAATTLAAPATTLAAAVTTAATTTVAVPVILGVSPTTGSASALTTYSNQVTLEGSAAAGSTVTVYNGTTALGSATANSQGLWTFTSSALAAGSYSFSATETLSGTTSASSATTKVTVNRDISSFSSLTDNWSTPISVGGSPYALENANVNGNAPWAITQINDDTLRFTLKPGDLWDSDTHRTEISGETLYATTSTENISYQLTVQPGQADTNLDWLVIGQMHADESTALVSSLTEDPPEFAFVLSGPDGQGGGDYLGIGAYYLPSGSNTPVAITVPGQPSGALYVSPTPIVRGQSYSIKVTANFQDNSSGFIEVWVNGVQVVDYHGPVGYGVSSYWKEGIYEGYTPTQPITVDYSNTIVTATPDAPIIASDVVSGNIATLSGTAEANSTVSIYDGSTLLGKTKVASSGSWSYATSALATGAHNFTAVATDSAGNASAASLASTATIGSSSSGTGGSAGSGGSGGTGGTGGTGSSAVTVATYLAKTAALDAAGSITISDTAAAVSAAFDALNADSHVTGIALTGTPTLTLNVTQALGDTRALSAITNSSYSVAITDTGANVAANFDALNADSHISTILPTGGLQNLNLTLTQMLTDTRAVSLLDPFVISVTGTAAGLQGLSTTQIATFASQGVTLLDATDADVTLTVTQMAALGAAGISLEQPFSGGTFEVVSFNASGGIATINYQGITGQAYTSESVTYGANGKPASAYFSNGMNETWIYNPDGSSDIVWANITGRTYTWRENMYSTRGGMIGTAVDLNSGGGALTLSHSSMIVNSSAGGLSVKLGADTFALHPHMTESINATGYNSETFTFTAGFGSDTISGFKVGGSTGDKLAMKLSMFEGLSSSNSVAQDVALLLSDGAMMQSGSNVVITDTYGDKITLMGTTTAALSHYASSAFSFS